MTAVCCQSLLQQLLLLVVGSGSGHKVGWQQLQPPQRQRVGEWLVVLPEGHIKQHHHGGCWMVHQQYTVHYSQLDLHTSQSEG